MAQRFDDQPSPDKPETKRRFRFNPKEWRRNGGKLFWAWVVYQAVKGMITLTLIWIPLFLVWLNR